MANSALEPTRELLKEVKEMRKILGKVELLLNSQYSSGVHPSKSERVRDKTIDNDEEGSATTSTCTVADGSKLVQAKGPGLALESLPSANAENGESQVSAVPQYKPGKTKDSSERLAPEANEGISRLIGDNVSVADTGTNTERLIPDDGWLPLRFSERYLETLPSTEAESIRRELKEYSAAISSDSWLKSVFSIDILDFTVGAVKQNKLLKLNSSIAEAEKYRIKYFSEEKCSLSPRETRIGRLILAQGLAFVQSDNGPLPHWSFCPYLQGSYFRTDHFPSLDTAISAHICCKDDNQMWGLYQAQIFQASFYELIKIPSEIDRLRSGSRGGWEFGTFDKSVDDVPGLMGPSLIQKACFTMVMNQDYGLPPDEHPTRWTIIVLAPPEWAYMNKYPVLGPNRNGLLDTIEEVHSLQLSTASNHGLPKYEASLQLIIKIISHIENRWRLLSVELYKRLDLESESFLYPEKFVHLLYDDSSFRRSRSYFWAIGCLSAFEGSLNQLCRDLEVFLQNSKVSPAFWVDMPMPHGRHPRIEQLEAEVVEIKKRLDDIRKQFKKRLDHITSLRDGLFNASAVMESRQSRILSENVLLLTFVSIFFLPLSFCVSLWSVPAMASTYPHLNTTLVVTVAVGLITYLVVMNLRTLVLIIKAGVSIPREYILKRTVEHCRRPGNQNSSWGPRPEKFEKFAGTDKIATPSHWWLLVYAMQMLWRTFKKSLLQCREWWGKIAGKMPGKPVSLKKENSENQTITFDPEKGVSVEAVGSAPATHLE